MLFRDAMTLENQRVRKRAICKTCTIQLVELCYERKLWFRLFREPLVLGMRIMSSWHGIHARNYEVRNQRCYGCIRFMKEALKDKSPIFCWLNDRINPIFNQLRDEMITPQEKEEARKFAREAMGSDND